jgi:RNA polymerase sigma-70 factor, ECF subfamily
VQVLRRAACSENCNSEQGAAVAVQGTDDELVAHCLQGRRDAFSELVLRHQRMVFSIARAMLGNAHAAEDMAQETFLHAYGSLSSYRAEGKFPAWLRMIVTRLCLNYRRDRRREVAWEEMAGHPAAMADGPESRVAEWERRGAVQGAVDALPPDYRDVIVLRFMEELSYAEIARHLGVPVSTVETRLHRAKKQLRQLLREILV